VKLTVVAAGKLKDTALVALCADYLRRVQSFLSVDVAEVRDMQAIRAHWSRHDGPRILLDERGEQIDTRELAQWIDRYRRDARDVALYIGDADGFSVTDRTQADRLLAVSRLTLPHRLVRLILLEQLYRAGSLLAGHPYHHG
jgi:23S rRNA (pseudouridine1915-N3)-methyltransferase